MVGGPRGTAPACPCPDLPARPGDWQWRRKGSRLFFLAIMRSSSLTKNIPDQKTCRDLMSRTSMRPNIMEHSYRVCQIALFLGRQMNRRETGLDLALVGAASLLHDITKTSSLATKENHAETAGDLLLELGYPEVADIVRHHVRFKPEDLDAPIAEVHLVNYADKRVLHTRVVTLEERFADLVERYGTTPPVRERIRRTREDLLSLEGRMFGQLDFPPSRLEGFNRIDCFDLEQDPPSPGS